MLAGNGCGVLTEISFVDVIENLDNPVSCSFVQDKKLFEEIRELKPSKLIVLVTY